MINKAVSLTIIFLFYSTVCFGDISGHVRDYRGIPVENATVNFTDELNPDNTYSATTNFDGSYEISGLPTSIANHDIELPSPVILNQNYPNPFNPHTTISFSLESEGYVELNIYNILGQHIRNLIRNYYGSKGMYSVTWDGLDDSGVSAGSGIYIYRLRTGSSIVSKKMLLLDSGRVFATRNVSNYASNFESNTTKRELPKIAFEISYNVVITGENIEPFEKNGVIIRDTDPSIDFLVARTDPGFRLSIVHTNDTHGVIVPSNGYGEAARAATLTRLLRNQRQNVLMLDAGDRFQRIEFNEVVHNAQNQIINLINYDCMTIGNWDLSWGPELFSDFASGTNAAIVSCNINVENEPVLQGLFEPYMVKKIDDRKIGLIGVATTERNVYEYVNRNSIDHIILEDIIPSVQKAVDDLQAQNINIIILISHSGYTEDSKIAGAVDDIDIIVGGHDHVLFSNTNERAPFPYPVKITSPSGEPVLIVQSGYFNQYVGCLDIIFNENGIAQYWSGDSYNVKNVSEDYVIKSIVD